MNIRSRFDIKIHDLEVESCDDRLDDSSPHTTAKISQWVYDGKPYKFVIAHFIKQSEGFDLKFVNNRVFEYVTNSEEKMKEFFEIAQIGYGLLMKEL